MRGKLWTFVRPQDASKIVRFESDGTLFSAMYKAKRWLLDNGYRYGSADTGAYIPAIKGEEYTLPQKLYNFEIEDYLQVNAVCYSGDYRDGWVEVWLVEPMYILDLILKHEWYAMIERGEKPEEYRDLCDHWRRRILGKPYTHVRFHDGYTTTVMLWRIDGVRVGRGNVAWGAPADRDVIILSLGERWQPKKNS